MDTRSTNEKPPAIVRQLSVHFDPAIPAVRPEERVICKKKYSKAYLFWIPPLGLLGKYFFVIISALCIFSN